MATVMLNSEVLNGHRVIDLRDPDDTHSWADYIRWERENELWHKRSEAAKKGWETRKRNQKKSKKK